MSGHFRLGPRYPIRVRVAVWRQHERGTREVQALTENLGLRGAFVQLDPPFPPQTRVVLAISTATTWEPLKLRGEVRWVRDARAGRPAGVGIAFEQLAPADALALHRLFGTHGFEEE